MHLQKSKDPSPILHKTRGSNNNFTLIVHLHEFKGTLCTLHYGRKAPTVHYVQEN